MMHKTNQEEIRFFNTITSWWGENNSMLPLHQMNQARLKFIVKGLERIGFSPRNPATSKDFSILDVGCGGGLIAEPLTRLGANVTGLDASEQSINSAKQHASAMGLPIRYQLGTLDDLDKQNLFDVVLALEIVEHVDDPATFIKACLAQVKPGGLFFLSTLNRTKAAYLGGILGAERLLKWLPKGTHDWYKFLRPSEVRNFIEAAGATVFDMAGINLNLWNWDWQLGKAMKINYILAAQKSDHLKN